MRKAMFAAIGVLGLAGCGPDAPIDGPLVTGLVACPPLPKIARTVPVTRNVIKGPFKDHVHADWTPETELIELRWLPVKSAPFFLHSMLVYTQRDGAQFVIAGFPEKEFNPLLALGDLVTQVSAFNPRLGRFGEDLAEDGSRLIIAADSDLSEDWARMARVANVIERLGVNYDLAGPNSNSVAATVLKYAGYEPPRPEIFWDIAFEIDVFERAIETNQKRCDAPSVDVDEVVEKE